MDPEALQSLLNGPALAPPPGVEPDFDNPPGHRLVSLAIPTLSIVLSALAVFMRLYTRAFLFRKVDSADYSLVIAWCLFCGYTAIAYLGISFAPGVHQWDVQLRTVRPFLYRFHQAAIMYGVIMFFIKLSILVQYLEVFTPNQEPRSIWWITVFFLAANFIFYAASTILQILACTPTNKAWDPLVTGGHCIDVNALNVGASSLNVGSNMVILTLPQFIIWRLNMNIHRKLIASIIFLVATFACASAIVRLVYSVKLQHTEDVTYYAWQVGIWTMPELAGGFVVASLSVAKKFFCSLAETPLASFIQLITRPFTNSKRSRANIDNTRAAPTPGGDTVTKPRTAMFWGKKYGVFGWSMMETESSRALHTTRGTRASFGEDGNRMLGGQDIEQQCGYSWELRTVSHHITSYDDDRSQPQYDRCPMG
ncbi:hypothetical protein F4780DRAFT_765759 [Xylariomycetidae sp. FL0641]|nr:hypothetical protein F4780DRAFT_765759 [Xylariomycetidae sp. FL0641]